MIKQLLLKGSIIVITLSLLLAATFFAGKAVTSYASGTSGDAQTELTAYGPCWRCGGTG